MPSPLSAKLMSKEWKCRELKVSQTGCIHKVPVYFSLASKVQHHNILTWKRCWGLSLSTTFNISHQSVRDATPHLFIEQDIYQSHSSSPLPSPRFLRDPLATLWWAPATLHDTPTSRFQKIYLVHCPTLSKTWAMEFIYRSTFQKILKLGQSKLLSKIQRFVNVTNASSSFPTIPTSFAQAWFPFSFPILLSLGAPNISQDALRCRPQRKPSLGRAQGHSPRSGFSGKDAFFKVARSFRWQLHHRRSNLKAP